MLPTSKQTQSQTRATKDSTSGREVPVPRCIDTAVYRGLLHTFLATVHL